MKLAKQLKFARQQHNLNLEQVAELSHVSAGLISKIENFKTIPSLPVLLRMMLALKIDLSELTLELAKSQKPHYILIRKGDGSLEHREDSKGLTYDFLFSDSLPKSGIRAYIVTVKKGTYRKHLSNDELEFIYVLRGSVHYFLKEKKLILNRGDTLFFDGSIPHALRNTTQRDTILLKLYFICSKF